MGWRLGCYSCRTAEASVCSLFHVLFMFSCIDCERYSLFGTIFLRHNSTTIITCNSEPVLFSSVIKSWISEGNKCWIAPITALSFNCCLKPFETLKRGCVWPVLERKVEPGKAERSDADLWNLFDGRRTEEECEMTSMRSRESCLSDSRLSLIGSTPTWGVRVLSPAADECDASRGKLMSEKGDDCDDNKIQFDIRLCLVISWSSPLQRHTLMLQPATPTPSHNSLHQACSPILFTTSPSAACAAVVQKPAGMRAPRHDPAVFATPPQQNAVGSSLWTTGRELTRQRHYCLADSRSPEQTPPNWIWREL